MSWTAALFLLFRFLSFRSPDIPERRARAALWLFAVLPSVWAPVALIPQEEAYVAIFSLLLYAATLGHGWGLLTLLFPLTALAAKYFLLILVLPAAFLSPTPVRNAARWSALSVGLLGAHVAYHRVLWGVMPILSYVLEPTMAISVWGLMWHHGVPLSPERIGPLSVFLTVAAGLLLVVPARLRPSDPARAFAIVLCAALLTLSICTPGYIL